MTKKEEFPAKESETLHSSTLANTMVELGTIAPERLLQILQTGFSDLLVFR